MVYNKEKEKAASKPFLFMFSEINVPVEVAAFFRLDKAVPFRMWWGGREIAIKKVNLTYYHRAGRNKIYYFAVSDGENYYKLQFDTEGLNWTLLEVNAE